MIVMETYNEHFQRCDGRDQITKHIGYGFPPLSFGILFPSVATSYMMETLLEMPA